MFLVHPAALWLLLLVPVLFMARRRPQIRVPVANLYLWRAASPSGASTMARRVRRHRLLLLQILFLVAVILAVARPLVPLPVRSVVVVIVDSSLSMNARDAERTRLDTAKARAAALAADLPWGTAVRLVSARAIPEDLGRFRSSAQLGRAMDAIQPSVESADLAAAIQEARASAPAPSAIHVFSDQPAPASMGVESDVHWSIVGAPVDNAAVTSVSVEEVGPRHHVLVSVTNYGAAAIASTVAVAEDGRTVSREPIEVDSGSTAMVASFVPGGSDSVTARLETDDALVEDNERFASLQTGAPVRVLLIGGGFFLEQALRVQPGLSVTLGTQEDLAVEEGEGLYDVVVCQGCPSLPPGQSGVLWLPTPDSGAGTALLTRTALNHPILDDVDLDGVSAVPVPGTQPVEPDSLIATAGDSPAIVAYESGGRRVVEWRLDPSGGALPLSTTFPVLAATTIDWLAVRRQNASAFVAGSPLRWALPGVTGASAATVTGPDGRLVPARLRDGVLTVAELRSAGRYRVSVDGADRTFVVNPATALDSDLRAGYSPSVSPLPDFGKASAPADEAGPQREVTVFLLLLALGLLLVEWRYRYPALPRT